MRVPRVVVTGVVVTGVVVLGRLGQPGRRVPAAAEAAAALGATGGVAAPGCGSSEPGAGRRTAIVGAGPVGNGVGAGAAAGDSTAAAPGTLPDSRSASGCGDVVSLPPADSRSAAGGQSTSRSRNGLPSGSFCSPSADVSRRPRSGTSAAPSPTSATARPSSVAAATANDGRSLTEGSQVRSSSCSRRPGARLPPADTRRHRSTSSPTRTSAAGMAGADGAGAAPQPPSLGLAGAGASTASTATTSRMPGSRTTRSSPGATATATWSNGGTVVGLLAPATDGARLSVIRRAARR